MKVRVTRNYQITIPAEIRRKVNLKLGDILEVNYNDEREEIIIRKVSEQRRTLKAGKELKPEEIEMLIREGLEENL